VTDVVVTGRGVVTSLGEGADAFFAALLDRRSGIADGVGPCADFDVEDYMSPREARRIDRFAQFALAAADQAWAEAGLADADFDDARVGVVVGTGVGGLDTLERETRAFLEGGEREVSPHFVPMMMPNAAAGLVAMRLGVHGPGFSVSSACASGAHAIGEAKRLLERGDLDVVVAGGSESALTGVSQAAFKRMGATSREGISRPFDARRDGFVMGEGAGVLILEREEHARARGARVHGRIAGYGASNDAFHITQPDEKGRGALLAMRTALADAGAQPTDVGHVNAHGTSTPFNDRIEVGALRELFAGDPPPTSSTKSAIGHLLGAAGAVEAVVALAAIQSGTLPPTLNFGEPDPACDIDCIPDGPREAPGLNAVLSNSFGFGGQNATLVLAAA
jgi:3-oxoacyl-[acyl-carrier-protein] synthase II